jgi:hypothetical protein
MITSGLLKAINNELCDIADIYWTDKKSLVKEFGVAMETCSFKDYYSSDKEIILPHIDYKTNDSWQRAVALDNYNNHAVVLENKYSKGKLYVLTIPDNHGDLYYYPDEVLNVIRVIATKNLPLHLEAPSQVGLFVYDNNTFITQSFRKKNTSVSIVVHKGDALLSELTIGSHQMCREISGNTHDGMTYFNISIKPGTYRAFKLINQ